MWLLKTLRQPIPGNYFYVQTEGAHKQFDACPMVEEVAKNVSAFRIANHFPRPSLIESLEDVVLFTCARLSNNPLYCREATASFLEVFPDHPFIKKPCAGCGTPVKQN